MQFEDIFLQSVDSTQAYAKKNLKSFDLKKITCIVANEQLQGKGRFDRKWISPKDTNLYITFVFTLSTKTLHLTSIGHVLALSLVEVLKSYSIDSKIKWPNDVLINNKKLAGILCEIITKKDEATAFLGIGINVNMEEEQLKKIDKPATSLKEETSKTWNKKELLEKLKLEFEKNLKIFKEKGFVPFHEKFENLLLYIGDKICFFDGENKYTGTLHSITSAGELNLYMKDKTMKTFSAGDII
ncbi:MAG: biotin--[acetyl-CoA-carboxylase] ligase [Parachlamydiales bacterium]|nr:biotin--[acetyl-CoA-carboxylase] ligase [Parachlamydiales bacterium]